MNADPNLAEGHILLGKLLARDQRLAEAVSEYQQAVKLQPGFSLAHLDLGLALAAQGPRTSASVCPLPDIADYRHAAKHVPIPEIVAQKLRSRSFLRGRRISSYLPTRHELAANLRFFILRTHSYKKQA